MGVAYAAFYMARYNVAAGNVSSIRDQLQFSSTFMGWCVCFYVSLYCLASGHLTLTHDIHMCRTLSAGSWSYAATAPFTGQITDRIGGKNGMLVACLGAALCNLALGLLFLCDVPLGVEKALFVTLYACNVLVQGFGTSAVVKINAAWYAASERGLFAGVFNIMLTSGYFLSLGAGSSIIAVLGWAYVFIIPGATLLVMALVILCYVKSTPVEASACAADFAPLSPSDSSDDDTTVANKGGRPPRGGHSKRPPVLSAQERMKKLLSNYTFLGYLLAVFFLSWARDGFLNWFLSFFDAVRAEALTTADTAIIGGAWTIGGFVGGILCGWLSDVLFNSDRVMPIFIFSVLQAVLLGTLYFFSATCSVLLLGVLVFLSSVFLLGNYTLLSYTVPSDLPQDIAAGAAGIMTAVGYFSTGLSGAFMGNVIGTGGYRIWILSLMLASILAGMFTVLGSYFSEGDSNMMITEDAIADLDELTPLSTASRRGRRASIVRLSADFVMSPMPRRKSSIIMPEYP